MGNRCVITTEHKEIGLYLHWNGGRDSVEGFLEFCKRKGYPSPERDSYGWAQLTTVITNTLGTNVDVNLYDYLDTDNHDNGVYIIKNWKIIGREFNKHAEQRHYALGKFMEYINEKQPKHMQLNKEDIPDTKITQESIKKIESRSILSGGEGSKYWEQICRAKVIGKDVEITTWDEDDDPVIETYTILSLHNNAEDVILLENADGEACYLS